MEKAEKSNYILQTRETDIGYNGIPILSRISINISKGELLAVVGPNGCGKTSLLKTMGGLLMPVSGEVLLYDMSIQHYSMLERAASLAFLSQSTQISWPFTVKELVAQGRFPHTRWFGTEKPDDVKAVNNALRICNLESLRDSILTELSGGEVQRVLLARALAQEPELLILDEPVTHLDARYQIEAMELIKNQTRRGIAALVSLHDLNLAAMYADRIALFSQNSLIAIGSPQDIIREDLLNEAFGIRLVVVEHPENSSLKIVYHTASTQSF